jgi:hypothetical protein
VSPGWASVVLWGVLLGILASLQFVFTLHGLQVALALAVGGAVIVLGLLLLARSPAERRWLLPDTSYATVMVAVGVVMVAMGLVFGLWLVLIGAGVLALGAGGVARELLAARRSAS